MKNEFYDFYYDQSHFIKEFKRFTGLSYSGFENTTNDFGKLFYKEQHFRFLQRHQKNYSVLCIKFISNFKLKQNGKKNYNVSITVESPAEKAFKSINNVSEWWNENLEGSSHKLNDVFTIHFSENNFVTHKIVEFVPDKKVVWQVTNCYLEWLTDKTEWTNTKMSFEIITKDNSTQINFTHIGLVPEVECYNDCVKGWNQYVKDSLLKLINEGKGQPAKKK